jgi:hypothetical protein
MLYSILSFIWNLSGLCLLAAIIYLIYYGLYIIYQKIITYVNNLKQYFYPGKNKITLEELKEELDNLDGWKILQNRDTKKLKEDLIIIKKDFSILKFNNDLIVNNMKNEIASLKTSISSLNIILEKKLANHISTKLHEIKNMNEMEFKDMNNKIFKIKCMVDK